MLPGPDRLQEMALEEPVNVAVKSVEVSPAGTLKVDGLTVMLIAGMLMVMMALAVKVPAVAVRVALEAAERFAGGV